MTGKFYMFFRDDCDWREQLRWFIDNYMPADRQNFEHRYAESLEAMERIRAGILGVYTWDNGRFWYLLLEKSLNIHRSFIRLIQ